MNTSQKAEIQESLGQFGLQPREQQAYLFLLENGASTSTPVAQAIHAPLTTTQSILQRLVKKGIVHMARKRSRSIYEAKDPGIFKLLLEQSLKDMGNIIPLLRSMKNEQASQIRLRVYQGANFADIFRHALTTREKVIYEIVSARDIQQLLGEKFHFTRRRIEGKVFLKSLRVEKQEIKKYSAAIHQREMREARFLPRELDFTSSMLCWDDTVAFFSSAKEQLAWVVQSPSLARMLRQVFELLWSVSRRMETAG